MLKMANETLLFFPCFPCRMDTDISMGMGMNTVTGAPPTTIYPHSATLFAAISACVFVTIGVLGE